ncbi:hypothetical protein TUSST3_14570 [Streptomyces sp. TUS-ST3]|nr:hypothetical protein [Streptomyces sp. TUS-ST3]GLP64837.1 hypothetical protein TUSST3_14570 [Streptomyces sp. TUS-ST3]
MTWLYDRKGLHRNPAANEPQPVLVRTQTDDPGEAGLLTNVRY